MLNGPNWGGDTSAAVQSGRYDGPIGQTERELDALHSIVRSLNERLGNIASTTRSEADALFGVRPEAASAPQPNKLPPTNARLAGLRESLSTAHEIVSAIESQVGRFAAL